MSVVHIAGFPVQVGSKARQLCAWCGERLIDDDYAHMAFAPGCDTEPKFFERNSIVEVTVSGSARGTCLIQPVDGKLPANCCAKERRCSACGHTLWNHEPKRACHVLHCECKQSGSAG